MSRFDETDLVFTVRAGLALRAVESHTEAFTVWEVNGREVARVGAVMAEFIAKWRVWLDATVCAQEYALGYPLPRGYLSRSAAECAVRSLLQGAGLMDGPLTASPWHCRWSGGGDGPRGGTWSRFHGTAVVATVKELMYSVDGEPGAWWWTWTTSGRRLATFTTIYHDAKGCTITVATS